MGQKRKPFDVGRNYCTQLFKAYSGAFERDMKIAQRHTTTANEVKCLEGIQKEWDGLKSKLLPLLDEKNFNRDACEVILKRMHQIVQRTFKEQTFTGYQND